VSNGVGTATSTGASYPVKSQTSHGLNRDSVALVTAPFHRIHRRPLSEASSMSSNTRRHEVKITPTTLNHRFTTQAAGPSPLTAKRGPSLGAARIDKPPRDRGQDLGNRHFRCCSAHEKTVRRLGSKAQRLGCECGHLALISGREETVRQASFTRTCLSDCLISPFSAVPPGSIPVAYKQAIRIASLQGHEGRR
jgi:hypothetical protein